MSPMLSTAQIMTEAYRRQIAVPAFNIPYLPMMAPVVEALRATRCFGLIMVARLEWVKFESGSMAAIAGEYEKCKDERFTRLHLDHMPVIDEDNLRVDYHAELAEAIDLGYQSIMVDGSRLPLEENIAATLSITQMAHAAGVPVEAELGAVMGHESGPMPPYEELFASGAGFTDVNQARQFVQQTQVDWLSVAVGSVHGAISKAKKSEKKVQARLNLDHLESIRQALDIPLVLHGGTGIAPDYIRGSFKRGIAKINIATAIRQPYEALREQSIEKAQQAVLDTAVELITDELALAGSADVLCPWAGATV